MALTTNLISYWKLDESSGNASDSVGSLTLTNTNTVAYSAGKISNGADFGASNTNKTLQSSSSASGITNGACSLQAWIKPTALPTSDPDPTATTTFYFVSNEDSSTAVTYNLTLANVSGTQRVQFFRGKQGVGGDVAYGAISVSTSAWTHIAGTYDGTTVKVYVNGILQATTAAASGNGSGGVADFRISGRRGGTALYSGMVDEVAVWSRGLSADEVLQIYNNGKANAYPLTDTPSLYGTTAYWKLDESSGNAVDSSAGGYTLTNNNTVAYASAVINNGADFGTANTNKSLSIINDLTITGGSATLAGWFKMRTEIASGQQSFFRQIDGGTHTSYQIFYDYNGGTRRLRFQRTKYSVADQQADYTTTLGTSNFYHLVLTYDGATITGYVNGSSVGTVAASGSGSSGDPGDSFVIGDSYGGGLSASCYADEVGIWSRALTSGEVTSLYNSGTGIQFPFTSSSSNATFSNFLMMMGV